MLRLSANERRIAARIELDRKLGLDTSYDQRLLDGVSSQRQTMESRRADLKSDFKCNFAPAVSMTSDSTPLSKNAQKRADKGVRIAATKRRKAADRL